MSLFFGVVQRWPPLPKQCASTHAFFNSMLQKQNAPDSATSSLSSIHGPARPSILWSPAATTGKVTIFVTCIYIYQDTVQDAVMVQLIYLYIHIYKWRWTPPQCIAVDTASIYSLDLKRWTPPPCIERVIRWLGVWMAIVGICGCSIQSCKKIRCNCRHGVWMQRQRLLWSCATGGCTETTICIRSGRHRL